jgi:proline dehydrogenase
MIEKISSMDPFDIKVFEDTEVAFSYKSDRQLKKAHFLFSTVKSPIISKMATASVKASFNVGLPIEKLIRRTVFDHFCGGITIADCQRTAEALHKYNVGSILDYSVEGGENEAGFAETTEEIAMTIRNAKGKKEIPFCAFKVSGIAPVDIFEKVQNKEDLTLEEADSFQRAHDRIEKLCRESFENDVPVFIDAEDSWYQDVIDDISYEMMAKFNKEKVIVFNTYQMYRVDMLDNLRNAIETAGKEGYQLGAKLVRGAYMEKERDRAEELGYPDPICPDKEATDKSYNDGLTACVDNIDTVAVANCSHNEYSNYYLAELLNRHGIERDNSKVFFAQLFGMSDNISFNLAKAGFNVSKYVPYGPVKSVMPYLFRRASENTSVEGQSSRELQLIKQELKRRRKST